ncbi:MAG: phage GP46 family protein [Gammaproteobacteria bacterium]|nr:phage GP46 family protein [Gammaproteobacteria bacterium]
MDIAIKQDSHGEFDIDVLRREVEVPTYGLRFTGLDGLDYVNIPDHPNLRHGLTDFSVEIDIMHPHGVNPMWMLGKGDAWLVSGYGIACYQLDPNLDVPTGFYLHDGTTRLNRSHLLKRGVRYKILWVIDRAAGILSQYVDGQHTLDTDISLIGDIGNTNELRIGTHQSAAYNGDYFGVRMYSRVIDATEAAEHAAGVYSNNAGLELWLPFREGQGTKTYDQSGNGHIGSFVGAPSWIYTGTEKRRLTKPEFGLRVSRTANYHYLSVATHPTLDFDIGDFSIETILTVYDVVDSKAIINKGASAGLSGFRFGVNSSRALRALIGDTVAFVEGNISPNGAIELHERLHLVATFDRDGLVRGYINGVETGSFDISAKSGSINSASDLRIGQAYVAGDNVVHAARLYNRLLTPEEVAERYAGQYLDETGLVLHMPIEEGYGTTTADTSGNGHVGTFVGSPEWVITGETELPSESDDLATSDGLDEAILISLFTDARVDDESLLDDPHDKRGHWADTYLDEPIGSKLWLLDRSKITDETLRKAREYAIEALRWMVPAGLAKAVDCSTARIRSDGIGVTVAITLPDDSIYYSNTYEV